MSETTTTVSDSPVASLPRRDQSARPKSVGQLRKEYDALAQKCSAAIAAKDAPEAERLMAQKKEAFAVWYAADTDSRNAKKAKK